MSSDPFICFTEEMLAVARRISSFGVTVYGHESNWVGFGGWVVVAGNKIDRFQFRWDGRALEFTISRGVLISGTRGREAIRTLNLAQTEAISGMETFLRQSFTA